MIYFKILLIFPIFLFSQSRVAIIEFEAINVTYEDANAMTRRLTSELIDLREFIIVERSEMRKLLDEQKFQSSGCVDMQCAIEIGKIIGAQFMILSSISKVGRTYSLDSRLISVASSESYMSARYSTRDGIENILEYGVRSIAHEISDKTIPKDVIDANKSTVINYVKKNKMKIGIGAIALWIVWGLLPPV